MAAELTELFREAMKLVDSDRAALAGLLIESLEGPEDPDVEKAWAAEVERRWQEIKSGKVKTIPWDEIKQTLSERGDL
jgi:putative addiction module component (TIGR02574 family)